MTLISWNIEGALTELAASAREVVAELGYPDLLCLQEVRVRRDDRAALQLLTSLVPDYVCYFALPRDDRNVKFRGGRAYGVASFARGDWRGEVPDWDSEGRIVVLRRPGCSVVNVYAVNGTWKPYFDKAGVVDGTRHHFKRRFQARVMDLGRELRNDGKVIMAGDWNVSRAAIDTYPRLRTEYPHARARRELNSRIEAEGFVDIWRQRHPVDRAYTWFNRRATDLDAARVDYILVSQDMVDSVRGARILDRRYVSDHAPIRLDWDD